MQQGRHILRIALAGALVLALGPGTARAADTTPPVIKHTPVKTAVRGEPLVITAHIKDESEIFGATLWYRPVGGTTFLSAEMSKKSDNLWGASISVTGDVEYWLEAYDEFGNGPSRDGSPSKPYKVKLNEPTPIYAMPKAAPAEPAPAAPAPEEPISIPLTPNTQEVIATPPAAAPAPAPAPAEATPPTEAAAEKPESTPEPAAQPHPRTTHNDSLDDLSAPPKSYAAVKSEGSLDDAALGSGMPPPHDETPVYRTWWFITGVSAVGVAAIVTAVVLLQPQPVYRNVFGATLQPQ